MFNLFKKHVCPEPVCPDPFADKVKCEVCKCWIDKEDAFSVNGVKNDDALRAMFLSYYPMYETERYPKWYCRSHKKPYSSKKGGRFYAEIEVNEDGTPKGYKKIK